MVNFLGAPRSRKLRSVISNASNDSGASLDAGAAKVLRHNHAPRKQLSSPRGWTERKNTSSKNASNLKREGRDPPPRSDPSSARRNISNVQFDSRNPLNDTPKSNSRSDTKNDHPRDSPPDRSPKDKPQIRPSIHYEVVVQPLSPKSQNVITSPRGILKTGNKEMSSSITPASTSSSSQQEKGPRIFRLKKSADDETLSSLTSDQTAKTKTKKKGIFSRFVGRRDKDDRSTSDSMSMSATKEIVHEIIANDTRRVSMSPIVVTVGGPEVETKDETNVEKSPKKASRNASTTKSPRHDRVDRGISNFVDNLTAFARIPASNLSRSAKKHGSFLMEVFHSEPVTVLSPGSTTPKQSKSTALPVIPTELPVNAHEAKNPRQTLAPVDPTRQQEWIVSVIEAVHRARRMPNHDYESMIDSEDSDILDGPRVVYMTSGELDDASVSSIEVLFHWMTCTMDRVYPAAENDHRGTEVAGEAFSLMEDESTEGSLEY